MSVLPAAPAATREVGDDPDRTPEGDVRVALLPLLVGGGEWRAHGVKESSEPSPTPVVVTERMFWRVATMSSTRTVGRIAVAIGTGIAALAISLTAADIASARPPLCERGIDCPPPKPRPADPDHSDIGTGGGQYPAPGYYPDPPHPCDVNVLSDACYADPA